VHRWLGRHELGQYQNLIAANGTNASTVLYQNFSP